MLSWITTVLLYGVGIGFFWLVGGANAAGEAFRSWGEHVATRRRAATSSQSL
jgi:hypothetical protein